MTSAPPPAAVNMEPPLDTPRILALRNEKNSHSQILQRSDCRGLEEMMAHLSSSRSNPLPPPSPPSMEFCYHQPQPTDVYPRVYTILTPDRYAEYLHKLLETLQFNFSYKVMTCPRMDGALNMLRQDMDKFDFIVSRLPTEDGLEHLKQINSETGRPVLVVTGDKKKKIVLIVNGIPFDVSDAVVDPAMRQKVRNILQRGVVEKMNKSEGLVRDSNLKKGKEKEIATPKEGSENGQNLKRVLPKKGSKERRSESGLRSDSPEGSHNAASVEGGNPKKKPRLSWNEPRKARFKWAVYMIGIKNATPKNILNLMGDPSLTKERIASHLQKFRSKLKKKYEGSFATMAEIYDQWMIDYTMDYMSKQHNMTPPPNNQPTDVDQLDFANRAAETFLPEGYVPTKMQQVEPQQSNPNQFLQQHIVPSTFPEATAQYVALSSCLPYQFQVQPQMSFPSTFTVPPTFPYQHQQPIGFC